MATSVDEKVVQLTLDSKDLNEGAQKSIDSIEKLKKALEFEGAIESFDKIEKEIKRADFNPLTKGIEAVSKSWTALDTIVDATLRNMTNRMIDTGERMIKSLTTDQITAGWDQYAERTGAVQTIMAATAAQFNDTSVQMEKVNDQLDKLTWFTDETSHKFNDMVSGIGKFTANNVGLETSVKAMEGIATWASISGANTLEASRAIYNLAQAVSVGSVKLIDWRSIENANMGTTEFKKTVIQTAEELGTLKKVADGLWETLDGKGTVSISNFSEELSKGWFTSDVLLKSLEAYGGFADDLNKLVEETGILTATAMNFVDDYVDSTLDMDKAMQATGMSADELTKWLERLGSSENELGRRAFRAAQETKTFAEAIDYIKTAVSSGWATSFTYIFGDYLEAKEWWSEIAETMYDAFVVGGEIRNQILELWKEMGGREDFLEGIRVGIENVMGILDIFKSTWKEVWYGQETYQIRNQANALIALTKRFRELMEALKPTGQTAENLHIVLTSLFDMIKTGTSIIKAFAKGLSPLAELANILAGTFLELLANLSQIGNTKFQEIFNTERLGKITATLQSLSSIISALIQFGFIEMLELIEKIFNAAGSLWNRLREARSIQDIFVILVDSVEDFFRAFSNGETFINKIINFILIGFVGLYQSIKKITNDIFGLFVGDLTFTDIFNGIEAPIGSFGKLLDKLQIGDKIKGVVNWIGILVDSLAGADGIVVGFIRNVADALGYFGSTIGRLLGTITIKDIKDLLLIGILWQFVGNINGVTKAIKGTISNFSGTITAFNNVLRKFAGQNVLLEQIGTIARSTKILQIGALVYIIVEAFKQLNQLDYEKTQQSAAALGVTLSILLGSMAVFVKLLDKFKKVDDSFNISIENSTNNTFTKFSQNIIATTLSLLLVVKSFKDLNDAFYDAEGKFDWKKFAIDLGAIGTIVTGLVMATNAIQKFSDQSSIKSFLAVVSVANGLKIVVSSIATLAKIDMNALPAATLAATDIILALGIAVRAMGHIDWKSALSLVPVIFSFTTAMLGLTGTIGILSTMVVNENFGNALNGLIAQIAAMTLSITVLGVALRKTPAKTIASIGLAMIEFSTAFGILSLSMKNIESYDWEGSKDAIWALGVGFTTMSGALAALGIALQNVKPDRITAIGISMDLMAASIFILSKSLQGLQGIEWSSIKTGVLTIGGMVAVFGALSAAVAFFDVQTFGAVSKSIDNLSKSFLNFGLAITAISTGIFILSAATGVFAAIVGAIQSLAKAMGVDLPEIVSAGFDTVELIVHEFLEMLQHLAPDFLATFTALFSTIWLAIQAVKHPAVTSIIALIIAMADAIVENGDEIVDALVKLINFVNSATPLFKALEDLCQTIGEFIGTGLIRAIGGAIKGLGKGFLDVLGIELDNVQPLINDKFNGSITTAIAAIYDDNTDKETKKQAYLLVQSIIEGVDNGTRELSEEMYNTGRKAMLYYQDAMGDGAYEATKEIPKQVKKGVDEVEKDVKESGKRLGEAQLQGYIEAQDPDEPMDKYRWLTELIGDQVKKGMISISGDLYNTGASGGDSVVSGFLNAIQEKLGKYGVGTTKLVEGFKSNKYAGLKKSSEYYDRMREKEGDILREIGIDVADTLTKAVDEELTESGQNTGINWVDNISKGAGSSSSKSKLKATSKSAAETIADSFAKEIEEINRKNSIQDKLYKLWTAQNPYASEMEKAAKDIERQTDNVNQKIKLAEIAEKKYMETLKVMGESAKETQEAYASMLDLQIEVLELQNELTEAHNKYMTLQTEAANARERSKYDYFDKDAVQAADRAGDEYIAAWEKWAPFINYLQDEFGYNIEQIGRALLKDLGRLDDIIRPGDEYLDDIRRRMYDLVDRGIGANEILDRYGLLGEALITDGIASGINDSMWYLEDSMSNVNDALLNSLDEDFSKYYYRGYDSAQNITNGLSNGLTDNLSVINKAAYNLGDSTWDSFNNSLGIHSPSTLFTESGRMIGSGVLLGIQEMRSKVRDAAVEMAMEAYNAACRELQIHSPSRKMEGVGENFDLGFINGIDNYSSKVQSSVRGMVNNLIDSSKHDISQSQNEIQAKLQRMFDLSDNQLHMTVVVDADTDQADRAISELERIRYSGSYAQPGMLASSSIRDISDQEIYRSRQLQKLYDLIDDYVHSPTATIQKDSDPRVVNLNYTQNNTSPKALSRVDIYRNTQRQLDAFANKFTNNNGIIRRG